MAAVSESAPQTDWSACVERVAKERCRDSFMQLFDHFAPRINSYLRKQGVAEDLAEDLAQEAMLLLWRKARLYNPQKALVSTWVFRVARNLMIDNHRRSRGLAYDADDALDELSIDDSAPDDSDAALLQQKVAQLPKMQAELVYLSYFEGKSHSEIAAETGQPLGSVKSRLRAALQNLRRDLNSESP